jgi:hypothetical protein
MDEKLIVEFVPLFQTLAWVLLISLILFNLRKEIRVLLDKLISADEIEMSVGSLSIQAKAMREIHRSIEVGFPSETISKAEIDALMDIKLKSIQAAIERSVTKDNVREDPRVITNEEITITRKDGGRVNGIATRKDGGRVNGIALDVSEAGIGFKSDERLRFGEIVTISPRITEGNHSGVIQDPFRIVRIEESIEGYHYGATTSST